MKRKLLGIFALLMAIACMSSGCGGIPKDALVMRPETVERRQMQTRRFDSLNEAELLSACAGLLQDLGFTIESSETKLGLVVGSKDRDATEAGQVIGATLVAALFGGPAIYDDNQKLRASIVTHPSRNQTVVRVTFQRVVWNNYGQISKLEALDEPEMYQDFFDRLSKAVFLEAHEI